MKLSPNEKFIFFIKNGIVTAVDTERQRYFSIDQDCFDRIGKIFFSVEGAPSDADLLESGFLVESQSDSVWGGDDLSRLFFLSTRNLEKDLPRLEKEEAQREYLETSETIEHPSHYCPQGTKFPLPEPSLDDFKKVSLYSCLKNRKTCREFFPKTNMSIEDLSSILFLTFGPIHGHVWDDFEKNGLEQVGYRRSSPSMGALQICDCFVWVSAVNGLDAGIYFYHGETHSLIKISDDDHSDLIYTVGDQFWVNGISVGLIITTDFSKVWKKYGAARSLAITYTEVGHFSQTLQLCATGFDYQTWITGIFRDDFLGKKLKIPDYISPSFFVGLGKGSGSSLPVDFLDELG